MIKNSEEKPQAIGLIKSENHKIEELFLVFPGCYVAACYLSWKTKINWPKTKYSKI